MKIHKTKIFLSVILTVFLSYGIMKAADLLHVSPGMSLNSSSWNSLVDKVNTLSSGGMIASSNSDECSSGNEGSIRINSGIFEGCNGSSWISIGNYKKGTSANPGLNCKDILLNGGNVGSGYYWIKSNSNTVFQAYCDMTTDGGGWTLIDLPLDSSKGIGVWSEFSLSKADDSAWNKYNISSSTIYEDFITWASVSRNAWYSVNSVSGKSTFELPSWDKNSHTVTSINFCNTSQGIFHTYNRRDTAACLTKDGTNYDGRSSFNSNGAVMTGGGNCDTYCGEVRRWIR